MKAVILCAGKGTRMRPFTFSKPKHILPLMNRPILNFALESMKRSGIHDIGIVVSGENMKHFVNSIGYGEELGLNLKYIVQNEPLGLAHAVKCAEDFVNGDSFILYLGDNVIRMDFSRFVRRFEEGYFSALLLVDKVEDPSRFGVVVMDEEEKEVIKLIEKPKEFVSDLAIVGLYAFNSSIFDAIDMIKPSGRGEYEITDAIDQLIRMGFKVGAVKIDGWWKDVGNPSDLLEANGRMMDEESESFKIESKPVRSRIFGKVDIRKGSIIEMSILNGPIIVGENTRIIGSRVGSKASIGRDVEVISSVVENSIIMEKSHVENVILVDSVVGENVTIVGNGEKIRVSIGDYGKMEIYR